MSTSRGVEAAERDVVAGEERLERLGARGHDRRPARGKSGDRLGVRLRHPLHAAEELQVLGPDVRDHHDRTARDPAERRRSGRAPRIPISVIRTRVSGSSRQTVSGRPISLFRLFSAQIVGACGAHSAPRMSFVVVFPAEPTTATTCASLFARTSVASAGERRLLVVRDERRCAARASLVDVANAGVQRDEEVS